MLKYCPECGDKLEESFKFCPNCGKKLIGEIAFCPECGKKMILSEKKIVPTPEKRETFNVKKRKSRITFPKLSHHIPRKTAIIIIAIICLAVVVSASILIISPFNNGSKSKDRTFTVTIENKFNAETSCYLTVDGLKQGVYGIIGFNVPMGNATIIEIKEKDLKFQRDAYKIDLYATTNDITKETTADAVTESADFLISTINGEHQIECTNYQ